MMITVSELRTHLGKYLRLSLTEDIYITRNGIVVAMLTKPFRDRVELAESLAGVLENDVSFEEAKEERLSKI